ncbi:MFS transporter [Streptoalloteichus tenebrarius]|uniref:MFS transporter n=1 Tax=Streptoalloteichus tenebrarius (strain ATCC 17920 / DSM 40477 / JCM 4838 / CBS 697.72 / NBRC 16177 / NCIMB 11028 / NRRL B-12390 / A12253. 1 / ISP 5477) TaxID=1933 RepID=UPI0020A5CE25|nr:MFS transporter [Streptoalloteichus tenebrarius]
MAPVAPWERRRRAVTAMVLTTVLVAGQQYAVVPLLTELGRDWSAPPADLTELVSAFGVAAVAAFLLGGSAARRLGTRPAMALAMAVLAFGSAALAAAPSLAAGGAFRVVQGVGAGFFLAGALTHLRDRVAPDRWPAAARWVVLTVVGAGVAGPALAEAVAALVGWRGVFGAGAVALVWSGAWLHLVLATAVHGPRGVLLPSLRQKGKVLARPRAAVLCLAMAPVLGGVGVVGTALESLGPETVSGDADTMVAVRTAAVAPVALVALAGGFLRRLRALRVAATALVVDAAATAALAVGGGSVGVVAVALVLVTLGVAVAAPALHEALAAVAGEARDSVLSLSLVTLVLGASLEPRLVSVLGSAGLPLVLGVVAAAFLVAAGLVVWVDRTSRGPAERASAA